MAALTSPPFVVLFACSWSFVLCQGTQQVELTVNAREDATLQCRSHGNAAIEVIKWIRSDLKPDDGFVFFFREGRSYAKLQHESYRDRVELRDPEMKDGDASVILKNVTFNDTGTYECLVKEEKETGSPKLITTVSLTSVTQSGHTAGHEEGGDKEGGGKEVGVLDGGVLDGGVLDGGVLDGGVREGGVLDGGVREGGVLGVREGGVLGVREGGVRDGGVLEGGVWEGGRQSGGGQAGGDKEGNVGLTVVLPVCLILLLLLLGVVGFVIFKIYRRRTEKEQPPSNEAEKQNLHRDQSRDNNSDQPAPENVPMQAAEPADENHY